MIGTDAAFDADSQLWLVELDNESERLPRTEIAEAAETVPESTVQPDAPGAGRNAE